jgi:BMFP domain-containing protein YqiC
MTMLDPKKLEELAKQIADAVPPGVKNMAEGAETKVKQVLQAQLSKLDLVTREEFDIQSQVLIRTREKLEAMELRLAALEQQALPSASTNE